MIDNIVVYSRYQIEEASEYNELEGKYAIISISNFKGTPANIVFQDGLIDSCRVFFDDVESGKYAMDDDDARQILDFALDMDEENIDTLYVHCDAGISRSAGCAAALQMLWYGNDSDIFNNGKYSPNMHCYRTMLKEAGYDGYNGEENDTEARKYRLWNIIDK